MAKGKTKASNIVVWIILALLIVGLAGFGATNFGGSVQSVGNVGSAEISVQRYARSLDQELRSISNQLGQPVTFTEAQQFNIQGRVLQRLLGGAAMEYEGDRVGLSVGDAEIAQRIKSMQEFAGISGDFEQDTYEFVLQQSGLTPKTFEEELRVETAGSILQAGVTAVLDMPATYQNTLVSFLGETRSFGWVLLDATTLDQPVSEPDDATLQFYYDDNLDQFMLPETRAITYAWLSPDDVIDTIDIDADAIRALYDERSDEYNTPERRLVERIVFADTDAANAALARLENGEATFETLVTERGLDLEDADMGDVTLSDLGAAGDVVFGLSEPGIAGPVETPLGPALFRVNAILQPQQTAFEDVVEDLRNEYASDAARRMIDDRIGEFDDLLAGGATLEELAQETGMVLDRIDWTASSEDGIAAYADFAAAAMSVAEGDYPEIIQLDDGGVFALRLDAITDPRPEPFDDARDQVAEAWIAQETRRLLLEQAATLKATLDNGARLSSLGYITNVETGLKRGTFIDGAPRTLLQDVFALDVDASTVVEASDGVILAQLSAVEPADLGDPELDGLGDRINADARQSLAQDILESYVAAIQNEAGISLNQAALNAVHAQFPG